MDFFKYYAKEIISVAVPLLLWWLNRVVESPARLVQGTRHFFTYLIDEPTYDAQGKVTSPTKTVNIAGVTFTNAGRNPASNVEITFNWKPHHINIWPPRAYQESTSPDGRWTLKFPSLAPKEFLNIELLAVSVHLPAITSARCDECTAKEIPLQPQEVHPRWKLLLFAWFVLAGAAATIFGIISLLQFLVLR